MSKTIASQEKELFLWKSRFDKCHKSLHEMTQAVSYMITCLQLCMYIQAFLTQKQAHEANEKTLKVKTDKLEKLCRALQTERKDLRAKIKQVW